MRRLLRMVPVLLAAALTLGVPLAGSETLPQGGGANNVVIAQTTTDGSSLVRSSLQISSVAGPSVTSSNIATATATNCTGCHSTAVAVQVVFVTGTPSFFAPANAAAATNGGCTACGSFAYAWQWVPQVNGPVTLSPVAQQRIAQLRAQIAATAASIEVNTLDDALELQARLDSLTAQLKELLTAELAMVGISATGAPVEHLGVAPSNAG